MGKDNIPLILIADDSVLNRAILAELLKGEGYRTVEVDSGAKARKLAKELKPDLILLDIMMPGEDGFKTCLKLKNDPITQEIPIIFVSALDETKYVVQALEIGGVDYIAKPFSHPEILARIKVHLGLKFAKDSLVKAQSEKLNKVKEVQTSLLFKPEKIPEAKVHFTYLPLEEAGGDFLEILKLGEKQFLYIIGDISGHDISVGFYLSALKALCQQNFNLFISVRESLTLINKVCKSIFEPGQYVTANFVFLNRNNRILDFYNCAHFPLLILRGNEFREIHSQGDVIGSFNDFFVEKTVVEVEEGDLVFMFTDGLVENKNLKLDKQKLKEVILKYKDNEPSTLCIKVVDEMVRYKEIKDDLSFMIIEV